MANNSENKELLIQTFLKGGEKIIETRKNLSDDYLADFTPLEIKVYGGNFERAFKNFRSAVQKDRILALYKEKQSFEKPSVKRRRKANESRQKQLELEQKRLKMMSGDYEKEQDKKQKLKDQKRKEREQE